MERYALRIPAEAISACPGTRLIRVVSREVDGRSQVDCEVVQVVGFQAVHVYHYASDDPRTVEAVPELMSRNGWHFKHAETRFSPITISKEGRLEPLSPEDLTWSLLPPDCPATVLETRCRELVERQLSLIACEVAAEERDQGAVEGD